jgi:superfamily II DNA or RNA helicase
LTHTHDLLKQSKESAESLFNFDVGMVGTIMGGKVDIGTHITFATVQTMAKLDLSKYRTVWDVIVVDECQHCAGSPTRVTQFYKVVTSLCARYKYGLTATPKRADGLHKSIFALLGGIVHTVSREEVAQTTCEVRLQTVETGYTPDPDNILRGDGTIDYMKVIDDMVHDESRFECVLKVLNSIPSGEPFIVLASRCEYLESLNGEFEGRSVCISGTVRSKKSKKERANALEQLRTGEIDAVFATYQLAKEGLDVPNLRYIVLATPEKDETTVIQSVGRVGRKAEGKPFGTVIDFVDSFGMYQGWYKKRCGYYKKIGVNTGL